MLLPFTLELAAVTFKTLFFLSGLVSFSFDGLLWTFNLLLGLSLAFSPQHSSSFLLQEFLPTILSLCTSCDLDICPEDASPFSRTFPEFSLSGFAAPTVLLHVLSPNFNILLLTSSFDAGLSLALRFNQCLIDGDTAEEDDGNVLARFGVRSGGTISTEALFCPGTGELGTGPRTWLLCEKTSEMFYNVIQNLF